MRWKLYLSDFQEIVLGIHFCLLYWKLKKKKKISRALVKYLPFTDETVQAAKSIFVTREIIYIIDLARAKREALN